MTDTTTQVKERPILFSTPMVQAIDAGRKTVTRRVIKESFNGCLTNGGPHPCPNDPVVIYPGEVYESPCHAGESITVDWPEVRALFHCSTLDSEAKCRQGKPGDILWVRETWCRDLDVEGGYLYRATEAEAEDDEGGSPWKPSIFMPKDACRIRLEILSIRVERLHDITLQDAFAEGLEIRQISLYGLDEKGRDKVGRIHFQLLWEKINGADSWGANPWVWRIKFKKL